MTTPAIQDQASRLIMGQIQTVQNELAPELALRLHEMYVPKKLNSFFFTNSGSEAIETAVKLVRKATGRPNLIVMSGSFHGRTIQAMALSTSKTIYRSGYQPLPGSVHVTPFPNAFARGMDEQSAIDFAIAELESILKRETAPYETAAIFIEPVLGEGGIWPAPARYMQFLRRICTEHGILMVADEVQSGFGRTGKFYAYEHAEIEPDVVVMAKGLGGGTSIAAVAAAKELFSEMPPGSHGGTYGGSSLINLRAAIAVLEVISEDRLVANAFLMGELLEARLHASKTRFPELIGDVRGKGLMFATEFTTEIDPSTKRPIPAPAVAKSAQSICRDEGSLLLLTCGPYENALRWIPPLIVNEAQINDAVNALDNALTKIRASKT